MTGLRRLGGLARADFLRSVGVYVTRDRLYAVRMRRSLFRFSLGQVESIPVEEKGVASQERRLADAIQVLLPLLGPKSTSVYVCFAPELVVECQVSLPEAARDDVERVLEYELERLIPFRRDEIYYDYLPPVGATGGKISVSLFAVPKTLLNTLLDALASGGYELAGAESVATSLFNYLLFCNRHEPGSDVIVGAREDALVLDGLRTSGRWSTSSEILYTHRMPDSAWSRGLGKEMLEGLVDESPRLYSWGGLEKMVTGEGGAAMSAKDLLELGRARILMPTSVSDACVPAIGACLRGLRESALPVNFLPGSKHRLETKSSFGANAVLAVLLLTGLVVWGASYAIKDEIRLRQMEAEVAEIQPLVTELQVKEEELNRLRAQFESLAQLGAHRGEAIRVLDELSRTIPTDAYLSNLRYRDGSVELRGTAVNSSNLIPLLEGSGLFQEVGFNAPSTRRGRDDRETFSLTTNIERHRQSGGT